MEDLNKITPTENNATVSEQAIGDLPNNQESRESVRDTDPQIDELVHTTSELNGLLQSNTITIVANLNQANHFYRFDVVEGESYRVVNDSTAAALIVYISETGDTSYGAEKTQCIQVSPNNTGIFVAPHNALYIGFYNNANSVNVEISHKGYDDDIKDISQVRGVVLTSELHVLGPLAQNNHFYKYDIVAGQKYTIYNDSENAGLHVYTSQTGETSYSAPKIQVAQIAPQHSQVIFPTANARYIGFYNNADDVDFTITHEGLDSWATEMLTMRQDIDAMASTVSGLDNRITASKAEAIATSENYTDAAVLAVSPTGITWDQLSGALQSMIPPTGGGNITNAPDGEDLTVVNSVLKFADKNATLIQHGGKSRVFLRKNIQNGKNILNSNMINAANTLYILQYDYDLNGGTATLGNGSSILFYGGSVKNGTLNYVNGSIIPACDSFFGNNLRVETNEPVNIAWYGAKSGSNIDSILEWLGGHTIIIPVGNYICQKSGYVLKPNTMIVGEKILNNDQTCRIEFDPSNPTPGFIIGLNNNCGFKDITLYLANYEYNGDLVRVDSAFWQEANVSEWDLQALKGQQYYIDNVYFHTAYMQNRTDHYLATAFHVIIRDTDDNNNPIENYRQNLSYRQHFKNVEIKYFSVGIRIDLIQNVQHSEVGVWCNSLHFFDIDMWVRNNGIVFNTSGLGVGTQGRFLISGVLLQAVGQPDEGHPPYAFYAPKGYGCMLDKINAYDYSRVAYVFEGTITLGQYMCDQSDALTVGPTGCIKIPKWLDYSL